MDRLTRRVLVLGSTVMIAGGACAGSAIGALASDGVPVAAATKDKGKGKKNKKDNNDKSAADDAAAGTDPAAAGTDASADASPAAAPSVADWPASPDLAGPPTTADVLAAPTATLPAPTLGQSAGIAPVAGDVLVRNGAHGAIATLDGATALPTGSTVDARNGAIDLATAVDAAGHAQTARFWGGIFEVRQARGSTVTQIVLTHGDFSQCTASTPRAATMRAAQRSKPIRSLWGSDHHGRYQTKGTGSVATVRGTRWLTEDFCNGTRTTVVEGAVAVHDLARHRTIVVKAGHSYFAAHTRSAPGR